jgi:hypothetical protein
MTRPVLAPHSLVPSLQTATPNEITALPSPLNLTLYAGDDFGLTLTLTDQASQPVDLTGATVNAQIRQKSGQPIEATFAYTIATNVITLNLTGTDTQDLSGSYVWDCQVTYSDGVVSTIVAGSVKVTADVTRTDIPF